MLKQKLSCLLLPLLFASGLFSQTLHDGLEFSKTVFTFPKAENWVSTVDSIEVTNHTDKKIHLLKTNDPRGFEVRYPSKAIEPGKTEVIEVIFAPKETGKFNLTFPIYHSASQTPVYITYKGEILNFDEFAIIACPSFSKPNLKPPGFELEVLVRDSATKKPLEDSHVEIFIGEYFSQHKTNADGVVKKQAGINYYLVYAEHKGYAGRSVAKHVNPKNRKITVDLPATDQSVPVSPVATAPTPTVVVPEIAPTVPATSSNFPLTEYKKNNIVFLIDKSSSMNKPDCMPLVQQAMTELTKMMRAEDRITIITYSSNARVTLPGTPGNEHEKIITVINELRCGGRTEGGKAIHIAYENARANFIKDGVNQIIIATDGGFNGLSEDPAALLKLASDRAKDGIELSVLAFGQNHLGKSHIEQLAKEGKGFYLFIQNEPDARTKLNDIIRQISKVK